MPNAEQHQRKHPRVKAPKGLVVAWQTGSKRKLSYLQSMAMGGLFIGTPNPAPLNSPLKDRARLSQMLRPLLNQ